jgi:hypothetical protein
MNAKEFLDRARLTVERSPQFIANGFEVRQNVGYQTVLLCGTAVLRVVTLKRTIRLELADRYFGNRSVAEMGAYERRKDGWARIEFTEDAAEAILGDLQEVYEQCYWGQPVENFGCCSRYIQCSDERKCIHPDRYLARGCAYKAHLEAGRVFYGKNRNVD